MDRRRPEILQGVSQDANDVPKLGKPKGASNSVLVRKEQIEVLSALFNSLEKTTDSISFRLSFIGKLIALNNPAVALTWWPLTEEQVRVIEKGFPIRGDDEESVKAAQVTDVIDLYRDLVVFQQMRTRTLTDACKESIVVDALEASRMAAERRELEPRLHRAWPGGPCTEKALMDAFYYLPIQPTLEQMHFLWHQRLGELERNEEGEPMMTTKQFIGLYNQLSVLISGLALIKKREIEGLFHKLDIRKSGTVSVADVVSQFSFNEKDTIINQIRCTQGYAHTDISFSMNSTSFYDMYVQLQGLRGLLSLHTDYHMRAAWLDAKKKWTISHTELELCVALFRALENKSKGGVHASALLGALSLAHPAITPKQVEQLREENSRTAAAIVDFDDFLSLFIAALMLPKPAEIAESTVAVKEKTSVSAVGSPTSAVGSYSDLGHHSNIGSPKGAHILRALTPVTSPETISMLRDRSNASRKHRSISPIRSVSPMHSGSPIGASASPTNLSDAALSPIITSPKSSQQQQQGGGGGSSKRRTSLVVSSTAVFARVSSDGVRSFGRRTTMVQKALVKHGKTRHEEDTTNVMKLLVCSSALEKLSDEALRGLCERGACKYYCEGTMISTEGEAEANFGVIVCGTAGMMFKGKRIAELLPGHCFGEVSLVFDQPKVTSIRASQGGTFVCLLSKMEYLSMGMHDAQKTGIIARLRRKTAFLSAISVFAGLSTAEYLNLCFVSCELRYAPRSVLYDSKHDYLEVRAADLGSRDGIPQDKSLVIIVRGSCDVWALDRRVSQMSEGGVFGAIVTTPAVERITAWETGQVDIISFRIRELLTFVSPTAVYRLMDGRSSEDAFVQQRVAQVIFSEEIVASFTKSTRSSVGGMSLSHVQTAMHTAPKAIDSDRKQTVPGWGVGTPEWAGGEAKIEPSVIFLDHKPVLRSRGGKIRIPTVKVLSVENARRSINNTRSRTTWVKLRPDAPRTLEFLEKPAWLDGIAYNMPVQVNDPNMDKEREVLSKVRDACLAFQQVVKQGTVVDIVQYLNILKKSGLTGNRKDPRTNMLTTVTVADAVTVLKNVQDRHSLAKSNSFTLRQYASALSSRLGITLQHFYYSIRDITTKLKVYPEPGSLPGEPSGRSLGRASPGRMSPVSPGRMSPSSPGRMSPNGTSAGTPKSPSSPAGGMLPSFLTGTPKSMHKHLRAGSGSVPQPDGASGNDRLSGVDRVKRFVAPQKETEPGISSEGSSVSRDTSSVSRGASSVSREASLVSRESSLVSREASLVSRETSLVSREGSLEGKALTATAAEQVSNKPRPHTAPYGHIHTHTPHTAPHGHLKGSVHRFTSRPQTAARPEHEGKSDLLPGGWVVGNDFSTDDVELQVDKFRADRIRAQVQINKRIGSTPTRMPSKASQVRALQEQLFGPNGPRPSTALCMHSDTSQHAMGTAHTSSKGWGTLQPSVLVGRSSAQVQSMQSVSDATPTASPLAGSVGSRSATASSSRPATALGLEGTRASSPARERGRHHERRGGEDGRRVYGLGAWKGGEDWKIRQELLQLVKGVAEPSSIKKRGVKSSRSPGRSAGRRSVSPRD